jgi:hypothetical protein
MSQNLRNENARTLETGQERRQRRGSGGYEINRLAGVLGELGIRFRGILEWWWATMTRDEARRGILNEWNSWVKVEDVKNPTGTDALLFYQFLVLERDHLLRFSASGDKWQAVHGWLRSAKLISG